MKSRLYIGETWHCRYQPTQHTFRYPMHFWGIDIAELPTLDREMRFFGYNRRSILSIWDKDYLTPDTNALEQKLTLLLAAHDLGKGIERIVLITVPRFLGYIFNPVGFYLCYGSSGEIEALIAEVRNTFEERHVYVMSEHSSANNKSFLRFEFPKSFYVSPFLEVRGNYEILLRQKDKDFEIWVNITKDEQQVFSSKLSGKAREITSKSIAITLLRFPLTAWLTMTRIHWQALKLYYLKSLGVYGKPLLTHPGSQQVREPSMFARLRLFLISHARLTPNTTDIS